MPIRVQCKSCGTYLTVSEFAPMTLTCPRCLAKIQRPAATAVPPPIPIRAIPLDDEVENDRSVALPVIVLISIMIVLGLFIMAASAPVELKTPIATIIGILVVLAIAVGMMAVLKRRPSPEAKVVAPEVSDAAHPPVLNYSSVRKQPYTIPRVQTGWFVSGFFSSLLVCAGGFTLLAATFQDSGKSGGNLIYLLAVILSIVGLIWMATRINRRLNGFLLGSTIGLCLGMLALGPCAFCYLLTLQ